MSARFQEHTARVMVSLVLASACAEGPTLMSLDEAMNPETCLECHPKHYREWKSSMHANASDDPAFRGMVARGVRETTGARGDR